MAKKTDDAEVVTVPMTRRFDDGQTHTGPTEADVHPDEVENMKAAGWAVVE